MNEHIKKFAEQVYGDAHFDDEVFANLIIRECISIIDHRYTGSPADAERAQELTACRNDIIEYFELDK